MELEVTITNTSKLSLQKEEYCRLQASIQKLAICCTFQGRILIAWTLSNIPVRSSIISQQNADELKCYIQLTLFNLCIDKCTKRIILSIE